MRKDIESRIGSTLSARLNTVRMSEIDRRRALHALNDAELLVDGVLWVSRKIEQLGERLFLKPAFKH